LIKKFWMTHRSLFISGAVCAVLSYLGVEGLHRLPSELPFADAAGTYLPGFLFGAIMLAPRVAAVEYRWLRRLASALVGTLLYYLAIQVGVFFAVSFHLASSVASTLAALLGALATCLVAHWLIPVTLTRETWRKAAIFGALGGAVFGISTGPNASQWIDAIPIVLGLLIWQTGVALALFAYSSNSK
jgi:hypothetical protein